MFFAEAKKASGVQSKIVIIQLGDTHYDSLLSTSGGVDLKDSADPGSIGSTAIRPRSDAVAVALEKAISAHESVSVAICGDLTSKGDRETFTQAVAYLGGVLNVPARHNLPPACVHVVPGNHDVAWRDDMPFVDLGTDRFMILHEIVDSENRIGAPLTVSTRSTELAGNTVGRLQITSVNSCRAVGSVRKTPGAPEAILNALEAGGLDLAEAVKDAVLAIPSSAQISHETLDIPYLHPDDLTDTLDALRDCSADCLPVVITHHGFLPQGVTRVAPYTEMVNGGAVREQLLGLAKPALYLHGHIHRDTVEVLSGGPKGRQGGAVVVISAPELRDGFNEIEVQFDLSTGQPLGLVIKRHRVDESTGSVEILNDLERVSLVAERMIDDKSRAVMTFMVSSKICRGSEILQGVSSLSNDEVKSTVVRLVWEGLIRDTASARDFPFEQQEFSF